MLGHLFVDMTRSAHTKLFAGVAVTSTAAAARLATKPATTGLGLQSPPLSYNASTGLDYDQARLLVREAKRKDRTTHQVPAGHQVISRRPSKSW